VDVVAAVGTDEEAAAVVEPGEGSFDDPAVAAEAGAVVGLATGDDRLDASLPDEAAVLVVVVATVGKQQRWPPSRSAGAAADWRDAVEQGGQHERVVAVGAGQEPGQRHPCGVGQEVVLAARAAPVDGARSDFLAPFFAWI
jgi:hypothetical protein